MNGSIFVRHEKYLKLSLGMKTAEKGWGLIEDEQELLSHCAAF